MGTLHLLRDRGPYTDELAVPVPRVVPRHRVHRGVPAGGLDLNPVAIRVVDVRVDGRGGGGYVSIRVFIVFIHWLIDVLWVLPVLL